MKQVTPLRQRFCTFFFLVIALSFSSLLAAQVALQWAQFYKGPVNNGGHAVATVTDKEGNVFVTGTITGVLPNVSDYATVKYNAAGVQQWVAIYDGAPSGQDVATAMAIDASGSVYVTGWTEGLNHNGDFATIKYSNAGVQQWVVRYNASEGSWETANAIAVDSSGNVYVTGLSAASGGWPDYATVKYNTLGVQQWAQVYDGPAHGIDMALAIALDPLTHDVYVTGFTAGDGTGDDLTTIKYTDAGVQQWVQRYNGIAGGNDEGRLIAVDRLGNVDVSGITARSTSLSDYVTIQYTAAGVQQWVQLYNGLSNSYDEPADMVVDRQGNVYVTGFTDNGTQSADAATVKYSSAGQQQWVQLYNEGPGSAEVPRTMALDSAGNTYIAGSISSPGISNDYLTLKYNPQGVLQWKTRYDAFDNLDYATAIAVDGFNNVYVAGNVRLFTQPSTANDYYGLLKYVQVPPLTVTAGPDTTVYYGYGSTCVTLKAVAEGGFPPYRYEWTPPMEGTPFSATTTVCPTTSTTYTARVTDAMNTTVTATVVITVVDVRCGAKGKNVTVCHKGQSLCVATEAVAAHLKHGDVLGACNTARAVNAITEIGEAAPDHRFTVYPNPLRGQATITYEVAANAHVRISVYDLLGREVATVVNEDSKSGLYSRVWNADHLAPGIYQCRIVIGTKEVKVMKVQVGR